MCTTLTSRGCTFTVTLSIECANNAAMAPNLFNNLIAGWATAIEKMWNGPAGHQHYGCCRVRFRVDMRAGAGTPGFHQISVAAGPQTSFVNRLGPACTGGRWDALDTGNVAAHESGHLLGLPDEYDYGGPGGAYRNLNPQPAGQPESIMAQTWGTVAALQAHIDGILTGLGARCPWYCCILAPFHRLWHVIFLPPHGPILTPPRELAMPFTGLDDLSRRSVGEILDDIETGRPDALGAGLELLRTKGAEDSTPLIDALRGDSPLRRWAAVSALDAALPQDAREPLVAALSDQDVRVRIAAAASLARLGDESGVEALVAALDSNQVALGHPPELVADLAAQLLSAIAGRSVEDPRDNPETRAARWREWLRSR